MTPPPTIEGKGASTAPFHETVTFKDVAPRILDNGWPVVPADPTDKGCKLSGIQRLGDRLPSLSAVNGWCTRYPSHLAGVICGRIVVLDFDHADPAVNHDAAAHAFRLLGETIQNEGRPGRRKLWYRARGDLFPGRKAHPWEVLASGGHAVAFGPHPDGGAYRWHGESPLDVRATDLPAVDADAVFRWLDGCPAARVVAATTTPNHLIAHEGSRNDTLFHLVLKSARDASGIEDLHHHATALNTVVCSPPLADGEVSRIVKSVWRYKASGDLWTDGIARAAISATEFEALADEADALVLLVLLRLAHGAKAAQAEPFSVVPDAMRDADIIRGWGPKRYRRAREVLQERGFLIRVHEGGNGRGDPDGFILSAGKGAETADNITIHPPHALIGMERVRTLVQVRYDLDGSTTVTSETTTERLIVASALPLFGDLPPQPTPSEILRQTARATFRAAGRGAQSRAAEALGITRGQLASYLSGRYGLNPPAEAALRRIVDTGGAP